jgi:hypothetical protein
MKAMVFISPPHWLQVKGVDLVDAVDKLGPSFVDGALRRGRFGFVVGTNLFSVVFSHAIGVCAVEMDQVLVGLGDVDEHAGEELERVGQSVIRRARVRAWARRRAVPSFGRI